MRQIKFEAVDSEGNIIRDVGQIEFFTDGTIIVNGEIPVKALREWTGLHDKNGKEIYEGDIVDITMDRPNGNATVQWLNGAFVYDGLPFGDYVVSENTGAVIGVDLVLDMLVEVIGNVYSNPEILQKEGTI